MPAAGVPCWVLKKLRPLPVHSWVVTSLVCGSFFRSLSLRTIGASAVRGCVRPSPKTLSSYVEALMVGVAVWLRTKSRDGLVR